MSQLITPRTLKGFRDYLPASMIPRERLMETARRVYRSYGFAPIDTPALEYTEILLGKGGQETDKQLFRFQDAGDRDVAMRFDLTVPLARFVAQHINELGTPFKRYHIAPVWRGETPQKGRFREFYQCDFDTIGTLSNVADIETCLVIHELLLALGVTDFTIRVNNRMVLNGLLHKLDLAGRTADVLRSLDKLGKTSRETVIDEMIREAGTTATQAAGVLDMASLSGSNDQILLQLDQLLAGNELGEQGVARLRELCQAAAAAGVPDERLKLDVSIARGLDYYTGTIYETFLTQLPKIGSVCSGGRYDNLAGLYTKQQLPGIGASLGLDRLLAALEELGLVEKVSTPAPVFIPFFEADRLSDYLQLAAELRASGIGVEFYPEAKKLGHQLKYADRRGFRCAVIMGSQEFESSTCQLKDLARQQSQSIPRSQIVSAVSQLLGTAST